ncbi:MAG: hypothetical protein AB7G25_14050 [Sphingomonadaceae bacterium]
MIRNYRHEIRHHAMERSAELEAMQSLLVWWTWPFTAWEAWMSMTFGSMAPADPEIDREDRSAQLPVPNPLQESKDSDLFA